MKPIKTCLCRKGHCKHFESDFDRFVKGKDTVEVNREWFVILEEMYDDYEKLQGDRKKEQLDYLLGYISSVKTITKLF